MPPVDVTIQHALPGAVVAAIGWVLLQIGFYYYSGSASRYAAYGLLGAILLFITLLYLGAIVLLVGAVVNVVLDQQTRRLLEEPTARPHTNE
jgi:membrane protein